MFTLKSVLILAIVVILFTFLGNGFIWFVSNKAGISAHCSQVNAFISENQNSLANILTSDFNYVVACKTDICQKKKTQEIIQKLTSSEKVNFFPSSYLIRLNSDGNLEKWFWSGEVKTTIPTTNGEQQVVRVLKGKSNPICTQNWKTDSSDSHMIYLHDGYSEAETILLIKKDGHIFGAMVSQFGD